MSKSKSFAERIDQAKMISEAMFSKKDTSGLEYHQKRLKICEACPYNSDNVSEKSTGQKIREEFVGKAISYFEKRYCTACGCPIDKKVGIARATCGLVDLGKEPLWYPVETSGGTQDSSNITILVESSNGANFYFEKDAFICEYPDSEDALLKASFLITHLKGDSFVTAWPTCSCTVPEVEVVNETQVRIKAQVSTNSFPIDATSTRDLKLVFKKSSATIRFKVKKLKASV